MMSGYFVCGFFALLFLASAAAAGCYFGQTMTARRPGQIGVMSCVMGFLVAASSCLSGLLWGDFPRPGSFAIPCTWFGLVGTIAEISRAHHLRRRSR